MIFNFSKIPCGVFCTHIHLLFEQKLDTFKFECIFEHKAISMYFTHVYPSTYYKRLKNAFFPLKIAIVCYFR